MRRHNDAQCDQRHYDGESHELAAMEGNASTVACCTPRGPARPIQRPEYSRRIRADRPEIGEGVARGSGQRQRNGGKPPPRVLLNDLHGAFPPSTRKSDWHGSPYLMPSKITVVGMSTGASIRFGGELEASVA